ncbi:hypothetical protein QWJ34_11480 [Saccharibacillus sp. CPCC 101409]|uniref:hypothetical protein n=1 Tax=Saccharibacillus sp. CPCC 101409 TaxID=3058041 RepID=UPI002672D21C|nr:hypothetical protein [Saccharibacillus sp. CPCC 101409]MDO3410384.1 hypothetical protein [Saccharibacillus sp. CPCC 101409]
MKKISFVVLGLFCLSFILTSVFNKQSANTALAEQVDTNMVAIQETINKEVELRSEIAMSSNPYDYIKDNEDFENIVSLGNDALPVLQSKIQQSPNDGLQEYILAIAIEEISKTDLKKNPSTEWISAKDFEGEWKNFLKEIPSKVDIISKSSEASSDKVNGLLELGTPAIPFIIDKVEEGNKDLLPALEVLTKEDGNLKMNSSLSTEELVKSKEKYKNLRNYVIGQ